MSASFVGSDEVQRRRTNVKSPVDLDALNRGLYPPPVHSSPDADSYLPAGVYQFCRATLLAVWFWSCAISIALVQYLGLPLYLLPQKGYYYSWIKFTKSGIGLLVVSMTQWFSPGTMEVSGDDSVRDMIRQAPDGSVTCSFADRLVLLANHQLYNDWAYLWWSAYTNKPKQHSSVHIILKDEIKYIPIIGTGLRISGFVFMSRKMAVDQPRLERRLEQLNRRVDGKLSPMWLVMFPEGTNMGKNGRAKSAAWAKKAGMVDFKHQLIPRSAGTYFCLKALDKSVEWVYDCTLAYDGIPEGQFGQDVFPLYSVYLKGKSPDAHLHWRRFRVADIPLGSPKEFDEWLLARWREKDELLAVHKKTGHFPSSLSNSKPIRVRLQMRHWLELWRVFIIWALPILYYVIRSVR